MRCDNNFPGRYSYRLKDLAVSVQIDEDNSLNLSPKRQIRENAGASKED